MKLQARPHLSIGGLSALAFFPLAPIPSGKPLGKHSPEDDSIFYDGRGEDFSTQSRTREDLRLARDIRNSVMNIRDLSMDGQNVEIIVTYDREVALRGTAYSHDEVKKILAVVRRFAPHHTIRNMIRTLKY